MNFLDIITSKNFIIKLCVLSLLLYFGLPLFSVQMSFDLLESIGLIIVGALMIFYEIRNNRHFSILDLVALREEIHQLTGNHNVISSQLEHYAKREDLLQYKLELNDQVNQIANQINLIANAIDSANNAYMQEEQYEEEKPKTKKRK